MDNCYEFGVCILCVGYDVNVIIVGGWLWWFGLILIINLLVIMYEFYWIYVKCFISWFFFFFYNILVGFS